MAFNLVRWLCKLFINVSIGPSIENHRQPGQAYNIGGVIVNSFITYGWHCMPLPDT